VEVRKASQFGEMIIIAAYIPILSLTGIEGKMFKPMAFTVIFALTGALLLSLTVVPALCALFLREPQGHAENPLVEWLKSRYERLLAKAIRYPAVVVAIAAVMVAVSAAIFPVSVLCLFPNWTKALS
jgi:cobalt-zinc-cadmium resistance protein CzcA